MKLRETVIAQLRESADIKLQMAKEHGDDIIEAAELVLKTLKAGGKVLIFGNGGSAADSQHIAAELVNRLKKTRRALPAVALTTDTSILTSVGNDISFSEVFARQIEALGQPKDLAWALSTSGRSRNVLKALEAARARSMASLGFTSASGGKMRGLVDCLLTVPSTSTPRVQEGHITVAHIICDIVEQAFAEDEKKKKKR